MKSIDRRVFLGAMAACAGTATQAQTRPVPIIDTHIHLFDQTRPQGAPYAGGRGNTVPSVPARYRKLASPLGIVGAIAIEASPWIEDNLWLLQIEETDPIMVGAIGNLRPEKPEFKEYLERYHKNKLFLGLRYGNLWSYSLVQEVSNPVFIEGVKMLQQADLLFETANPRPDLLEAVIKLSDQVPSLRILIDHIPALLRRQTDASGKASIEASIRELAKRDRIFIKVSEVMQVIDEKPSTDPAKYKATLDYLFDSFGEDKLVFGSDWPNGAAVENLPSIVRIMRDYLSSKDPGVAEKIFWKNSMAAYKWIHREPSQP
jgi:predicted TIM-barrel fold metal-dependent hydrolase